MMFTDIHTHILAGVDDGPKEISQMYELTEALYRDGARNICCTPHCHPGYYGKNHEQILYSFYQLKEYIQRNEMDLRIFLGNELHYSQGCLEWIEDGFCRTINATRHVLVDFDHDEEYKNIEFAVRIFLHEGYIPVLAHIERYPCIGGKVRLVEKLHNMGAVLQINAVSILKKHKYPIIRKLLRYQMADVVASDTHNMETRPPLLKAAYQEILLKFGKEYADQLFRINPDKILRNI